MSYEQDVWLAQRLANRLPKDHPDYDPFYDATDDELAEMIPPPAFAAVESYESGCPDVSDIETSAESQESTE
jgi:hypothetical protein